MTPTRRSRNTHDRSFQVPHCRIESRRMSFYLRTIRDWNGLQWTLYMLLVRIPFVTRCPTTPRSRRTPPVCVHIVNKKSSLCFGLLSTCYIAIQLTPIPVIVYRIAYPRLNLSFSVYVFERHRKAGRIFNMMKESGELEEEQQVTYKIILNIVH